MSDVRKESCHVHEESIEVVGELAERERARFVAPLILPSVKAAEERGQTLALIRPKKPKFLIKERTAKEVREEGEAFKKAVSQSSLLDDELVALEPSPYEFRFTFEDEDRPHNYENGDWETHAMFWRESKRTNTRQTLEWMTDVFNSEYPSKGMVFAVGNMAKRPQTWQLLGVIRADVVDQPELEL